MKPCRNNPVNTVGPAAFRRLCVETTQWLADGTGEKSAAFRRLCVETREWLEWERNDKAAAFRRLCVETRLACPLS